MGTGVFIVLLIFIVGLIFLIKETGKEVKEGSGKEEAAWNGIYFSNNFMFFYAIILLVLLLFVFATK
jgi:hypothetical protein|tara:strand:+ start:884 stop:1084 length:201 start_codon:yes stop_codon:yes gene_type:complete